MKILYGITKSNFGGAQRYVFDMALAAKKAGHNVAVLCGGHGTLVKELERNHIRVISLPHLKRDISLVDEFRSFHFIFRTLVSENPDVFHTNSSKMGGLGNLAARLAGVKKIIFTVHGWAFNEPRPIYQKIIIRFVAWLTVLLSHKTIAVSKKTLEDIKELLFIANRLLVISNGISPFPLKSRNEARAHLNSGTDVLLVGALAELHPIKGLDVLIRAWARFVSGKNAQLVILGEGEARPALEKLIREFGLENSVVLKGFVPHARELLSAFDIFVLPSRSEALPYTVLEAGLAALPVIASRVGGIPEVIETGISGVLVDPENPEALLSALLLLSDDPSLRSRLGYALKESILTSFSADKMSYATLKACLSR